MNQISITITGIEPTIANLQGLERDLPRVQQEIVRDASLLTHRRVVERMSDRGGSDPFLGRTGGVGNTLAVRSGQSRARITPGGRVLQAGDVAFAVVGSPDPHVAFLEEGGTIYGRQYLRIPLASAQTAQGVDRNAGRSLRDIPGLVFVRSHRGKLFAGIEKGGPRSRRFTFLYLLVPSVTLRGRHIFGDTQREVEPEIGRITEGRIRALVARANGHA